MDKLSTDLIYIVWEACSKIMNLYSKSYTSKITSGTVLALLAISGFAVVLALPIGAARAVTTGSGVLTLSTNTGVPVWNSYYKDFGTWVTVTGTGFPASQDDIQLVMIPSTTTVTATVAHDCVTNDICDLGSNTLDNTVQGYFNPSISGDNWGTVMSDANGWFMAQFAVPVIQGGSYIVYAIYPTTTGNVVTTTVPFTVTAAIYVVSDFTGATNGGVGDALQISGVGFNNAEQLQAIPSSFFTNAAHPLVVTGALPGVTEGTFDSGPETGSTTSCIAAGGSYCIGNTLVGGARSVTILGLSSGTSESETFTINPTIAFLDPTCTFPTFSIDTAAGAKTCVYGDGFAKSATIALSGSVTIGGVSTIHGEIDSNANGQFPNTVITLAQSSGVGLLNVVLGGITFNYANGNIFQPNANLFDNAAGVLLGSHAGQGAITTLPEGTSRRVGQSGALIGVGYNNALTYANTGPFELKDGAGNFYPFLTPLAANGGSAQDNAGTDANGAFVYWYTTPTLEQFKFILHDETAVNPSPDSTYTITPDIRFLDSNVASAGDYIWLAGGATAYGGLDSTGGLTHYNVATPPSGDLTIYVNGDLWDACSQGNEGLCNGNIENSAGYAAPSGYLSENVQLHQLGGQGVTATDLPQGSYNVNITGSYKGDWTFVDYKNSVVDANPVYEYDNAAGKYTQLTIDPVALGGALSIDEGSAGTTVALVSGQIGLIGGNPGIHGLAANTQYKIMWDTNTQLGTFTSTSNGEVPVGTQFTVPAGTSGIHVVDIQTMSGVSAIWGQVQDHVDDQFANLEFTLTTSLIVTPSIGSGGTTMTLSGNGLPANTLLYLTVCGNPPYDDVGPSGVSFAQFTSTSTGAVPANVTFTLPQMANPGPEIGSLVQWSITDNHGCTADGFKGIAKFAYQASMTLSSTVGPQGTTLTASANGLVDGGLYDIVFNYAPVSTNPFDYTGQIIGVILANNLGQGTAQITIPQTAASGTYQIGLVSTDNVAICPGSCMVNAFGSALNVIPTFTVGVGACTLTTCQFSISGTPTESNGYLSVTYTNPGTSQVTGVIIVSVQNALGQTVYITTATISPGAGQSITGLADLSLLPSGAYTANVFVVTLAGGSISTLTSGVPIHV